MFQSDSNKQTESQYSFSFNNMIKGIFKPLLMPFASLTKRYLLGDILARMECIEKHCMLSAAMQSHQTEVLLRSVSGYLLCPAGDVTALVCLVESRGDPEPGTRSIISRVLHRGDVFVDVGAHLGIHTLAAARAMQGRGKIIAFEPCESSCRLLKKTVNMNGFLEMTEIHQVAVSNMKGEQALFLAMGSPQHSLYAFKDIGFSTDSVVVATSKLDDILASQSVITLIKIDVEGAELDVLEGAALTMERFPDIALIVEFGPTHLKRVGSATTQQWLDKFTQCGFGYRVINEATGALEKWSVDQLEQSTIVNLFFARDSSPAWARAGLR